MKETIFEQVATAASVLKLDLSAEEFALFAEDREFSEAGMEAVQMLRGCFKLCVNLLSGVE